MYELVLAALLIIYTTITWRNFRLAVFLILACLPTYLLRVEIADIPLTFLELMLGVATIFWLKNLSIKNLKKDFIWLRPWFVPTALLLISGLIGIFISPNFLSALGIFKAYIFEPIVFFLILSTILKKDDDIKSVFMFLGLGAIVTSFFAIFQYTTGLMIPTPWDIERRVTSFFPYPNAVGLYLGPIIIIGIMALRQTIQQKKHPETAFWFLTITLSGIATVLAQTEAALVAIPAALIIISIGFKKTRLPAIAIGALAIILLLIIPEAKNKIFLQDYSGGVRLKQWNETASMLQDHWFFGAGLSGYPEFLVPYHTHEEIEIFQYPHNIVLNTWSELGLLGLLAFIVTAWLVWKNLAAAKVENSPHLWLAVAASAALLEMVIHGLVDVPFFKNDLSILTAVCLALLARSAHGPYAHQNVK
jgi:O-antigen ligase